jgi:hypothetical protein
MRSADVKKVAPELSDHQNLPDIEVEGTQACAVQVSNHHQGTLRASTPADLSPAWLADIQHQLQELLMLPENWNSYHARPITAAAVNAAGELLRNLAQADTPRPIVTPTVRGGVQLEWHTRGMDLDIELEGPEQFEVLFEDPRNDLVYEDELHAADIPRLAEFVARLSQ